MVAADESDALSGGFSLAAATTECIHARILHARLCTPPVISGKRVAV
ncbi:hypothetical protein BLSMQ_1665 [Brevibacterium aurantiacum]|uniref:Uncharacterized protein n=1 Tax=Brevibacterium aurantiacum TaxID=273384 RepID=A0A1D7W328_BREAU|nr:hypothetical protein BLSMQ_1665 [Brevibacterium aurantiacum]